jgi:prepilin-type N-terminal cleavage/methylation domain-containing protein
MWQRLIRALRDERDDTGFTMVELIVTMVIISTVLLGLIGVQISSLVTTSAAKQRQQASALANQSMEELRALPFATVSGGLYSGDLTGDANISGGNFKPAYDAGIDEPLVTSNNKSPAPLYPHVTTTSVGGTSFTTASYVTLASTDASLGYWLTTIVSWSSKATGGTEKSTAVRSRLYSPNGCLSTADHPFSGPCQTFLDGSAGSSGAGVVVAPVAPATNVIDSVDLTGASLLLPSLASSIQSEQVLSAMAGPDTSGGQYVTSTGTQSWDAVGESTVSDTDPGTGVSSGSQYQTAIQTASGAPGGAPSNNGWSITVTDGADTVTSSSTLAADSTTNCYDSSGSLVTNGQACAASVFNSAGGTVVLGAPSVSGSNNIMLVSVGSAVSASRSFATIYTAPTGSYCAGTSGDGCVHAGSVENLGTVSAGGLGTGGVVPAGWGSALLTVTGYSASASSESGVGSPASANGLSGSLSYWNGTGYVPVSLATPGTYTTAPATVTFSNGIKVTAEATVTVTAGTVTPAGSAPCQTAACSSQSSSGSAVAVVTYTATDQGGFSAANFTVTVNLGAAIARTAYRAAYSG